MEGFRIPVIEMLALVTATKNSAKTLPQTLESLSAISDLVLSIFVDGDSSDSTVKLLHEYVRKNKSAIFLTQNGTGLYEAINQGIRVALDHSDVTHIGLLHSDDVLLVSNYRSFVESIYRNCAEAHYSDIRFHNSSGQTVRFWKAGEFTDLKLKLGWMPPHTSMIVTTCVYRAEGLYRLDFGTSADYEWIVRVLKKKGRTIVYFPETTISMLVGGASGSSLASRLRANWMDGKVWSGRSVLHAWMIRIVKPLRKIGQFWSAEDNR